MPPLLKVGKKPPRFAPYKPQVQSLINKGQLKYKTLANLGYKPPRVPKGPKGPRGPAAPVGPAPAPDMTQAPPDYAGLIGGDWEVQQAITNMGARMGQMRGDFQANLRQALVDLGITDPSKLGGLGQYIDADTIKKAAENKYSMTARIAQAEQQKKSQSEAALAARGILSSGQTTRERTGILAEGENQRYDALRSFLSGGAQGLAGIADLNDQLAGQLAQARFDAAGRAAATYGMGLGEGTEQYTGPSLTPAATKPTAKKVVRRPVVRRPPPPPKRPVRRGGGGPYRSL